jgi:hypothetical protein
MIKTDHRCPARFVRHPEDPRDAAVFKPQVPVGTFVLKYQKPL